LVETLEPFLIQIILAGICSFFICKTSVVYHSLEIFSIISKRFHIGFDYNEFLFALE